MKRTTFDSVRPWRWAGFGLLCAFLASGCTSTTAEPKSFDVFEFGCMAERADIVESVDWDSVQVQRIRIVDGEFSPMVMYLETGRPYVFVVENADIADHDIWAPGLLKRGVAVRHIQFGDKTPGTACVNGVRIRSKQEVRLSFVPVQEGRFEGYNTAFPMMPGQTADTVFNVIRPRVGTVEQ
ncbi:MAG: hypothetical protein HQL35_03975 [Alphaproteobacteria bacterium]|nr:hypothetical protein [Alphaproteobacteria bacterium]